MWIFEENEGSETKMNLKNGISVVDLVKICINLKDLFYLGQKSHDIVIQVHTFCFLLEESL